MGRLLPFEPETTQRPGDPQVLDLGDEATAEALSALSSETAREILAAVYEEPQTPPDIRDEVGTSLQNVHYHIEKLEEADLIQPAGSGYSEKGTEMTVYAPKSEAVVLFAGQERHRSRLKTALARLLGGVGILGLATLLIQRLFDGGPTGYTTGGPEQSDVGASASSPTATAPPEATPTPQATPTPVETEAATETDGGIGIQEVTETPMATPEPTEAPPATETPVATELPERTVETADQARRLAESGGDALDPALAFFLGGAFMLAVVGVWWVWRTR
jgi:DNA-binding transcriptional ArsR family regulator